MNSKNNYKLMIYYFITKKIIMEIIEFEYYLLNLLF